MVQQIRATEAVHGCLRHLADVETLTDPRALLLTFSDIVSRSRGIRRPLELPGIGGDT